ncbi:MAG: ubiquinone/menaquinone biosynthesis methyltransferase [Chloroflexota bacterium]
MKSTAGNPRRSGSKPTPRTGNLVPEADVAAMFDEIAPVYDRVNTLITAGGDARWRGAAVRATRLLSGGSAIDVACGTGKLSLALADRVGPFGRVVGVDISPHMIEQARLGSEDLIQLEFVVGNALALPFERHTFDAATIAFGLRNLTDFEAGFRELTRVVRPGGRVVCLELSTPRPRIWRGVYLAVFRLLPPLTAALFARGKTYRYLPASLEGFPDPAALAATMTRVGLREVGYRRLAFGAVALHTGVVPD